MVKAAARKTCSFGTNKLSIVVSKSRFSFTDSLGYTYRGSSSSQANFQLFNTIWTILVLAFLVIVPRALSSHSGIISLPVLVVSVIFWFAGSIALSVEIGTGSCDGGSDFCSAYHAAQAACAFGFFIWVIFTVLTVLEMLSFLKGGGLKRGNRTDTTQMTNQQPQAPYTQEAQQAPYTQEAQQVPGPYAQQPQHAAYPQQPQAAQPYAGA